MLSQPPRYHYRQRLARGRLAIYRRVSALPTPAAMLRHSCADNRGRAEMMPAADADTC